MKYLIWIGLLIALLLVSCEQGPSEDDVARKICIEQGGIPITSAWSSQMADCKFPPRRDL